MRRVGQSSTVQPGGHLSEEGASPAQLLVVALIVAVVALVVVTALRRVGY
ncbi:MAG: hypothetical protein ACRDJP_09545 [Actinomycetota bacterium]